MIKEIKIITIERKNNLYFIAVFLLKLVFKMINKHYLKTENFHISLYLVKNNKTELKNDEDQFQ